MRCLPDRLSDSGAPVDGRDAAYSDGERYSLLQRLNHLPANHPSATAESSRYRRAADRAGDRQDSGPAHEDSQPSPVDIDVFERQFWSQTGYIKGLWRAHQERWPRPRSQDGTHLQSEPGSWRGNGNRYLSPDENAEADQAIAAMQEREPQVTALLQRLEQESPFGARLVGLDHRLKGVDRLKEKIVDGKGAAPGGRVTDAAAQISDAVRFTYRLTPDHYATGYADMCSRLKDSGCQMLPSKNFWRSDRDYRGINSRWVTPEGARFEVQFHTAESHYAKEYLTHDSYDRLRTPGTSRSERRALNSYQALVCEAIPVPPGVMDIDE